MTRKRILFVTTSTSIGGAEKTLALLAARIDSARFEVAGVICLKPKGPYADRLEAAGIRVESLDMCCPGPRHLFRLKARIEEIKPDIVHAFLYRAIQFCRAAKALGGGGGGYKLVSSPRVHFRSRPAALQFFDRLLKGADDLLVSESEASTRYLTQSMGYDPERVATLLNGVDPKEYAPREGEREQAREMLGLKNGEFLVGTVGRVDPQKGHEHLVEAVRELSKRRPQLRLIVVGDGPLLEELGSKVMRDGLSDRIWFLGLKPEVRPWLAAMDLFVLPSLWEGVPNAVLEAFSAGLPVVATKVDGVEEAVDDGRTGLLVEAGSPDELAAAIERLLADDDLRSRLAANGRDEASRRFTVERMLLQYEGVYSRL